MNITKSFWAFSIAVILAACGGSGGGGGGGGSGSGTSTFTATCFDGTTKTAATIELANAQCSTASFVIQPILLPDLTSEYATVCGTSNPVHIGVQSATILNMAGHKDGKKDLIFTLWCGQKPGTVYSGPTKNGAVFFEQLNDGSFVNVTKKRFGVDLLDVGGNANDSLAYDFNKDGYDDVVFSITGEDGRAEPVGYSGNNRKNFFLTSTSLGQYNYQSNGWPSYSISVKPIDNEFGGLDAFTSTIGYGGKNQVFRYINQWVDLPGYDWFSENSFFFKKRSNELASSVALSMSGTTVNLRVRSSPSSQWLQKDSFNFPSSKQVPWVSWQNSQYLIDLLTLDGKDYVGSNFNYGCDIRLTPRSEPVALTFFTASQLTNNYVSGPVVEGVNMLPTINPIAFSVVADKLQRVDLQVVGWEKYIGPFSYKCADLNNDGNDDFVIFPGIGGNAAKPLIFLNDGSGKFTIVDRSIFPDPPAFYSVTTATYEDIDGDGIRDLIYRPLAVDFTKIKAGAPVRFVIHKGLKKLK